MALQLVDGLCGIFIKFSGKHGLVSIVMAVANEEYQHWLQCLVSSTNIYIKMKFVFVCHGHGMHV